MLGLFDPPSSQQLGVKPLKLRGSAQGLLQVHRQGDGHALEDETGEAHDLRFVSATGRPKKPL